MKNKTFSKSKKIYVFKQLTHAYIPILLLLFLPHSFTTALVAMGYIAISSYVYIKKSQNLPSYYWEYYMINLIIPLFLITAYVEGL
ncbi:hypothetical protein [Caminibacter sp.]